MAAAWKVKLLRPLQSRKVRTAIATVIVAYLAEAGINVSETTMIGIIAVGVSIILGIAIEDAGQKSAGKANGVADGGAERQHAE
ncbi:MAG: hypothetical protein J5J06_05525 [Phycisphaerae bacterium]|nr:hypothetical protein [Phycisphaerae bacterium]